MTHYGPEPLHPFTSDGCSLFPDGDWGGCCYNHDLAYWRGGSWRQRAKADRDLRYCVASKGGFWYGVLSWLMWVGVRVGGMAAWPTKHRWGYGWPYPQCRREYRYLSG
jgi:hypothetical protein